MEQFRHATVVYQGAFAHVIAHCGAECKLLLKAEAHHAEIFAAGLKAAGITIKNKWTDLTGDDILHEIWHKDINQSPYLAIYHPV